MKELKQEVILELTECINQLEETNFLFLPKFEKAMAKLDLLQEKVNNEYITQLVLILKGNINSHSYPEARVSDSWKENVMKLLQLIQAVNV